MKDLYRIINLLDPTASHHAVNRNYCDNNKTEVSTPDGSGLLTGLLGGALGGFIANGLTSIVGGGLTSMGQISGSLLTGSAGLVGGLLIGSGSDFDRYNLTGN
jgi:hypothetical protein